MVATLFQHCYTVLRSKSSLRVVSCNISFTSYSAAHKALPTPASTLTFRRVFSCDPMNPTSFSFFIALFSLKLFPGSHQWFSQLSSVSIACPSNIRCDRFSWLLCKVSQLRKRVCHFASKPAKGGFVLCQAPTPASIGPVK